MPMRRTADARATIDGVAYAFQRFRASSRSPGLNVSNSEGVAGNEDEMPDSPGFTSKIPDIAEGQFQLVSASFDDSDNPFAAPIALEDGEYYAVKIFPAGLGGDSWNAGNCLCTEVTHEGSIPGAQPVTATFETDGTYRLPSS